MGMERSDIILQLVSLGNILTTMYLLTLFATKISYEFVRIADIVYFEKWYSYKRNLQIYVLIMIQNTQRMRPMAGLQIIYCNLETFMKVSEIFFRKIDLK